jgi:malonyl CoA-acyl carrier protein transacylase
MESDIQNIKIELIQWLTTLDDKSLIQKILDLRINQTKDWWDTISDAEKKSVEQGIIDADNGNVSSHSEARKVYEKWL